MIEAEEWYCLILGEAVKNHSAALQNLEEYSELLAL